MRLTLCLALAALLASPSAVAAEPVVRMLVPGFTVRELPIRLSNINNLRFAPDGRLTALGYDGRIWLLRDSDGDGLEDQAESFWDQPTLSVPVGIAWSTGGLYVSSHGKVSLIRDTNGDGRGDAEEVIASGWPPTDVPSGGADAMGVTLDKKGNVYFGMLTADYSNPYRVKDGVSHYDMNGVRGTIQQWDPRTRKLETIATGIRVPYALAFNKAGDLFNTDQEGETWCPNGNPLDELNHIIPGRNYGFPPRHEKWLPNLASEPPVVGFGPQHESTCGFVFNEPHGPLNLKSRRPKLKSPAVPASPGQGLFGPKSWEGDAFVTGESRGKIWRVRLVKTSHGYVGNEFLMARLSMLTTDVAISPKGDLYVSCHSGAPDWGTGPQGEGKIFRISHTDPKAPQPVIAWANGPFEAHIAFDKPLDPSVTGSVAGQQIEFGEHVRAADRYEVLKPPYQVVNQQDAAPRGRLAITAARLHDHNQTLVLTTERHPAAVRYALSIPGVKARGVSGAGETAEVEYSLNSADVAARRGHRAPKSESYTAYVPTNTPTVAAPTLPIGIIPGDWQNGKELFFGDRVKCSTCHRVRGEGGNTGPDLSNLVSRDPGSILRDIKEPSATINPDYVTYNATTTEGEVIAGFVRAQEAEALRLVGADGKEIVIKRSGLRELRPSGVSLMPAGLLEGMKEGDANNLLTFLLYEPPKRDKAEVERWLNASGGVRPSSGAETLKRGVALEPSHTLEDAKLAAAEDGRAPRALKQSETQRSEFADPKLTVVLVASKQDHGPGQHDYPAWQQRWSKLLGQADGVTVNTAWEWPTGEQFQQAGVVVFYFWNHDWSAGRYRQMDDFLERGGGVVMIHSATIADQAPEKLAERIGLAAQPGRTDYRHCPIDLKIVAPTNHPVTFGLPHEIRFLDELYWPMIGDPSKVDVLATTMHEGKDWPVVWTFQNGKGRVFGSILGHYTWTLDDPLFRIMALRGIAWAAGGRHERFDKLVLDL